MKIFLLIELFELFIDGFCFGYVGLDGYEFKVLFSYGIPKFLFDFDLS